MQESHWICEIFGDFYELNRRYWIWDINLHLERQSHLLLERAQVNSNHAVNKCTLVNMVVSWLLEQTEKSIIDDSWKLRVFKEGNFIHEFEFIVSLFRAVSPHCNILEYCAEIRLDNIIEEVCVRIHIEIFNQDHLILALVVHFWLVHRGLPLWRFLTPFRRTPHIHEWSFSDSLGICQRRQVTCLIGGATLRSSCHPWDLRPDLLGLLGALLLVRRVVWLHFTTIFVLFYYKE